MAASSHSSKRRTGSTQAGSRTLAAPEAVLSSNALPELVPSPRSSPDPRNANALQVQRWPSWEDVVDAVEWTNPLTFSGRS